LAATNASGGTHFSIAFKAIQTDLEKIVPPLRAIHGNNMTIVIAFMTDGEDSQGKNFSSKPFWQVELEHLKSFLHQSPVVCDLASVFHALAFGANHDFPFLDNLRANAGTVPGGFQYAEPTDGAAALTTKLDAIVNSISNPAVQSRVRLEVPGFHVNIGSCLTEVWADGTASPLKNQVLFSAGQNKIVLNLIVTSAAAAAAASSSSSDADSSLSNNDTHQDSSNMDASSSSQPNTTQESWTTPVNTSAGITYVTDYYGQVMPSFPQPGMSTASLYSYDPYVTSANFGTQPGTSHSFDFGPQPGSSHQSYDQSSSFSSVPDTMPVDEPISAATMPIENVIPSISAAAPTEAEIGAEYLTIKVFQTRLDDLKAGEISSELKIRVDHLHTNVDRLLLEIQKIQVILEAVELEITQAVLQQSSTTSWTQYGALLNRFEKQLNSSSSFLVSLPKSKRNTLADMTTSIRETFTKLHALLAQAAKGGMSTSQLARMAEVAHGAQFSKARHARTMDSRTSKNAEEIEKEAQKLRAHSIDSDAVTSMVYDNHESDEADTLLREWFCVLTQENWMNLLVDERDCVGFGIALRRPEFVLDDPTQLRILDISLTCVSKSAFEHVLAHKLIQASKDANDPIQAKLAYLGGFNVEGKDLGVVVRGVANEPINAWLPLYINEEHWKLAFLQFKSTTGYLVTLNPLGYAWNQTDVYFMILAIMIVRMKVANNRQMELAIQYLRTCAAIMRDCNGYTTRMITVITDFINDPAKRLKDVTPSLLVVLGFLIALPLETLNKIIPSDEVWTKLWLSLFSEITRRALDSCSRVAQLGNETSTLFTNLVSRLVDGYLNESELTSEELARVFNPEENGVAPPPPIPKSQRTFKSFSHGPSATDAEVDEKTRLKNTPASLSLAMKNETGEANTVWSAFWDAAEKDIKEERHAMEWASLRAVDDARVMPARAATSVATTSGSADSASGRSFVDSRVLSASFHIPPSSISSLSVHFGSMYVDPSEEKKAAAKASKEALVDTNEIKNRQFRASAVLPKSLEAIRLCENVVSNFGSPTIEGLINVMTFLKSWSNLQLLCGGTDGAFIELDRNLGVAPVSWLVHFRDDWQRRPRMRNSFFTFLNFIDVTQIPSFTQQMVHQSLQSEVLQLQMLRALLAQNAKFATNKDARLAIEKTKGPVHDRWHNPLLDSEEMLIAYHRERVDRLIAVAASAASASANSDNIQRMMATSDIYEFIGILISGFGTTRTKVPFSKLINSFYAVIAPARPLAVVKFAILLSGKFVDPNSGVVIVVIPGTEWVPGRAKLAAFHRAWGSAYKVVTDMVHLTYVKSQTNPVIHLDQ
jgi:hypothetical protein